MAEIFTVRAYPASQLASQGMLMGGATAALEPTRPLGELGLKAQVRAEIHPARSAPARLRQHWQELARAAAEPNVEAS